MGMRFTDQAMVRGMGVTYLSPGRAIIDVTWNMGFQVQSPHLHNAYGVLPLHTDTRDQTRMNDSNIT